MKKLYLLLLLSVIGFGYLHAQNVASYFFKVKDGVALEDMTDATPVLIPKDGGYSPADMGIVLNFPSGFSFNFKGTTYTQYSISPDGTVVLGADAVTTRDFDNPIVPTSGGDTYYNDAKYPVISPFATALNYPFDGSIKSKLVQSASGRKLVIEWKGNKNDGNGSNKLFQLWLYENTGLIQFVYGDAYVDEYTSCVIGIAASSSDFLTVNVASGITSSTDASAVDNVWPGSGTSYLLSPTPIVNATAAAAGATSFCAGGSVSLSCQLEDYQPTAYQWFKDNVAIANATNATYSATQTGNYSVQISFNGGSASSNAISVTANPLPAFTVDARNISCNGSNNGSVTLNGNNVSAYTTNWTGTNYTATGNQITNLAKGIYNYNVQDANGCVTKNAVTITEPDALTLSAVSSNQNGTITVTTNGSFTITDANSKDVTTNATFVPGTYKVTAVKDGGNTGDKCTKETYVTIAQTTLTGSVTSTNGTCKGTNDGTITVSNAAGGSGRFEYSIDGKTWQSNASFTTVASGTYSVQLRDAAAPATAKAIGTVTITKSGAAPAVTISKSAPAFSANISLTATSATAIKYSWSNNASATSTLSLSNADNDGNYTVTVTDAKGCTASAQYNYIKQNVINSYTVVGLNTIFLGESNAVTGSVGNTLQGQQVYISKNSSVKGSVKASAVTLAQPVTVTGGITYAPATMDLPAMYNNTSYTNYLPSITIRDDYNGVDLNGNYSQITIGKRAKVKLNGKVFGTIYIKQGADVTFTASDINIDAITTDNGAISKSGIDYTTISFASNTIIRIKNKVTLGEENTINASGSTFYVGDANPDMERMVIAGRNTTFNGNVYLPYGVLGLTAADATAPCNMNGMFVAQYIASDKYINWNGYTATAAKVAVSNINSESTAYAEQAQPIFSSEEAKLKVYPNPTQGQLTINLSNYKSKVTILIVDAAGKPFIQKTINCDGSQQSASFNFSSVPAQVYLVKIISDSGVQTAKVVVKH